MVLIAWTVSGSTSSLVVNVYKLQQEVIEAAVCTIVHLTTGSADSAQIKCNRINYILTNTHMFVHNNKKLIRR